MTMALTITCDRASDHHMTVTLTITGPGPWPLHDLYPDNHMTGWPWKSHDHEPDRHMTVTLTIIWPWPWPYIDHSPDNHMTMNLTVTWPWPWLSYDRDPDHTLTIALTITWPWTWPITSHDRDHDHHMTMTNALTPLFLCVGGQGGAPPLQGGRRETSPHPGGAGIRLRLRHHCQLEQTSPSSSRSSSRRCPSATSTDLPA